MSTRAMAVLLETKWLLFVALFAFSTTTQGNIWRSAPMLPLLMRSLRLVGCAVGFAIFASPAGAQTSYSTLWNYPRERPSSIGNARGVVLFMDGRGEIASETQPALPLYLRILSERYQWHVATIVRPHEMDRNEDDEAILGYLHKEITDLKSAGYAKIVLAGQSRGAWLAIKSGQRNALVHAAIATAPSTHGVSSNDLLKQNRELLELVQSRPNGRLLLFLFRSDPREGGELPRGEQLRALAKEKGLSVLLVDRPSELDGHGASTSGRFARRFSECINAYLLLPSPRFEEGCSPTGYAVGGDIPWPSNVGVWRGQTRAAERFAGFIGRWAGDDEVGAYRILQTTDVWPSAITMLFGFSPPPGQRGRRPGVREVQFAVDDSGWEAHWISPVDRHRHSLQIMPGSKNLLYRVQGTDEKQVWRFELPRVEADR